MPEETENPTPRPEAGPRKGVGTGFAGETTRSIGEKSAEDAEATYVAPAPQAQPETVGDFEILGKLGQGGMGAVYRARQVSLDRQVALKILPPALEEDADFVIRFQREARIAASLSHANLVKVYSSGVTDGCHYIAMELIEGETLSQWLKRGPLSPPEALRICLDVARALECGWRTAQLIHRDIKPGNIFLSDRGEVKVGDLGLAKSMASDTTGLTHTGTAMGTPHYISPEQARGDKDMDFRADIYSLGCTLYQMLTGRTPYEGRDPVSVMHQHIHAPPPAILKVLPQCPIPLVRLVGKMLKKIKRERQATYAELIAQIESVQAIFQSTESPLESTLPPDPDTTLLDTPGAMATPRSATPVTLPTRPVAPPPSAAAKKSPAVLYGSLAAGAIVLLAGGAFLLRPKGEEKLTKAELYARQMAAATPTPAPAALPSPGGAPAVLKLWDSADKIANVRGVTWENNAVRNERAFLERARPASRDLLLRASVLMDPEAEFPQLLFRTGGTFGASDEHRYALAVTASGKQHVSLNSITGKQVQTLKSWTLPHDYRPDEWARVEVQARGDELTVRVDGVPLGSVSDTQFSEPGGVAVWAQKKGFFRDIEYLPLDGVSPTASIPPDWKPLLREPAEAIKEGNGPYSLEERGLVIDHTRLLLPQPAKDAVIRAQIRVTSDMNFPALVLRSQSTTYYKVGIGRDLNGLSMTRFYPGGYKVLASGPIEPLHEGDTVELEFRCVGSALSASVNGKVIARAYDPELTEPGAWGISADGSATFGRIEGRPIEAAAPAAPTSSAPAATDWQPLFSDQKWREPAEKREFKDGLIHMWNSGFRDPQPTVDRAIRARVRFRDGTKGAGVIMRHERDASNFLLAVSNRERVILIYNEKGNPADLGKFEFPKPLQPGDPVDLELRAQGDRIIGLINGTQFVDVRDPRPPEDGSWGLAANDGWFESVQYRILPAAARGTTPTASKSAPFENSLGMKFVPVPIIGGPTAGQPILFSIWETRVQDYEVFATETHKGWNRPPFDDAPTYPALGVYRDAAEHFCRWLTERERAAGKIDADHFYRLPSDHEWSCAVGIGDREDAARPAEEKNERVADVYPWGLAWPPPAGAANVRGEEARSRQQWNDVPMIAGYRDAFPECSPVGSFAPNAFGLYDLGGNAWEWVQDSSGADGSKGIKRGGSFSRYRANDFLASRRGVEPHGNGSGDNGFRVVLAPVEGASAGAAPGGAGGAPSGPESWVNLLRADSLLDVSKVELVDGVLRLPPQNGASVRNGGPERGMGVRMRTTAGDSQPQLRVRMFSQGSYTLFLRGQEIVCERRDEDLKRSVTLASFPLQKRIAPGEEYELELRAVGETLTAKLNGAIIGTTRDTRFPEGHLAVGNVSREGSPAVVKKLEMLDLGPAPVPQPATDAAEHWQDMRGANADMNFFGPIERGAEGLRFNDAGAAMRGSAAPVVQADGAVRLRAVFGGARPSLRARWTPEGTYFLFVRDEKSILLQRFDNASGKTSGLAYFPIATPLQPGKEYDLELRVVGTTITAKYNGEVLGTVNDGACKQGQFGMAVTDHGGAPAVVRVLEVLDL